MSPYTLTVEIVRCSDGTIRSVLRRRLSRTSIRTLAILKISVGLESPPPISPATSNSSADGCTQLSVNVGKYNAWSDNSCETTSFGNKNCDEKRYINSLAPLLIGMGWGDPHFIIDQSRSGVQPSPQSSFENTCNIAGAGFGNPPGAGTNDPLADSFVWVKRMSPSPPFRGPM